MSDPADLAQPEEEAHLASALAKALKAKPELPYRGTCYNCDEPLPEGFRFCPDEDEDGPLDSSECRDDFDYRNDRRRANGHT